MIGRTPFVVLHRRRHALSKNFQRMLGWLCISGIFWIAGGLSEGNYRFWFWMLAVACEYLSPMFGLWLPGLGRSRTQEWTIEGGHMAERCQLFVIVALGESILVTGATIGHMANWDAPTLIAFLVAFLGSLAMWWIYFDTSSQAGTEAIVHSTSWTDRRVFPLHPRHHRCRRDHHRGWQRRRSPIRPGT